MEAFDKLPGEINHLVASFSSIPVVGDLMSGVTQYSFWLIVSAIVLLILMFAFVKHLSLVPHGRFANAMEYVIEYIENDIGVGILGKESWRKHMPFLGTLFMFIVVNNVILWRSSTLSPSALSSTVPGAISRALPPRAWASPSTSLSG